jgi:hypothetical protein
MVLQLSLRLGVSRRIDGVLTFSKTLSHLANHTNHLKMLWPNMLPVDPTLTARYVGTRGLPATLAAGENIFADIALASTIETSILH